jgi:hypothetical protein
MDDFERKMFFKDKLEFHLTDYCKEYNDIPCINAGRCDDCKGMSYDHKLDCKAFFDGWTQAVDLLTKNK